MAQANIVQKKVLIGHSEIVRYQLITHCFMEDIKLSNNELECLTLLAFYSEVELSEFCFDAVDKDIFKTPQTVRNFLNKADKNNLILKQGSNRKNIKLKPELNIQTAGNIILDYKIIYVTKEE